MLRDAREGTAALAATELAECAIRVVEQHDRCSDCVPVEVRENLSSERGMEGVDGVVGWIGSGHGWRERESCARTNEQRKG